MVLTSLLNILPAIISGISGYPGAAEETSCESSGERKSLIFETSGNIEPELNWDGGIIDFDDSRLQIRIFLSEPELDPLPAEAYDPDLTMDEAQALLKERRDYVASEIQANNEAQLREIEAQTGIEGFQADDYASLITLDVPEGKELDESVVFSLEEVLNSSLEIEDIYVSEIGLEAEPEADEYLSIDTAMEYCNVSDMVDGGDYTGEGVTVAIVDCGALDVAEYSGTTPGHNDYTGRNITIRDGASVDGDHADGVAMIAVGNNGIARGTDILSCRYSTTAKEHLSWVISNGANIANTSYGVYGYFICGRYTSDARTVDQMINNYLLTLVGSAGNYNDENDYSFYISSPKTAYNYITVGNSGDTKTHLISSSAFKERSTYSGSKPTLSAVGSLQTNALTGTGTSFSAPMVTGCLALLMEEYPILTLHPELCSSIVTASASPMSEDYNEVTEDSYYDGSGLHNQIGAGFLNYEKMREAAENFLVYENPAKGSGLIDGGIEINAKEGQRIRASGAWLAQGSKKENFTDYDLTLYKLGGGGSEELVSYISDDGNNLEFIDFEVKTAGTYWLTLNQNEATSEAEPVALSYVLIDSDVGGSASGATNIDQTDANHFDIATDAYSSFGSTYNSEETTDTVYDSNGTAITVNRLRSRYTSDGQFVLSAKSNDADEAYAEFLFDGYAVYDFHYEFGLWSDSENLIQNSSIDLYGLIDDEWELIRHFSAKEMTTDPDNPGFYVERLDLPAEGIRFHVTTNKTNNSNNVGRVVIGEIGGSTHIHSFEYQSANASQHLTSCACGYSKYESHYFNKSTWISGKEYSECGYCGYVNNITYDPSQGYV